MFLKEHCRPTQKKIWIHLMQNAECRNLTILDNPFKRYDFSKFSLNSVKSLCRPHKLATVPCHGCTTPHWFCTQIITNFQYSWIWVKLLIKLIPKSIQISSVQQNDQSMTNHFGYNWNEVISRTFPMQCIRFEMSSGTLEAVHTSAWT